MIKIHIKTADGRNRTESWVNERASDIPESRVANGNAYAWTHLEQGEEKFSFVHEPVWHIHDDVIAHVLGEQTDYAELALLANGALNEIGVTFEDYLPIEISFMSQKLGDEYPYEATLDQLGELEVRLNHTIDIIDFPLNILKNRQTDNYEAALLAVMLIEIKIFASHTRQSALALWVLITRLQEKARGRKYGFFEYRKNVRVLNNTIRDRRKAGEALQAQRRSFYETFPVAENETHPRPVDPTSN